MKMSEFGLTLSLGKGTYMLFCVPFSHKEIALILDYFPFPANEIISNSRYYQEKQILSDVLQHLGIITNKAVEGNEGEINTVLLGRVISFFNTYSSCMEDQEHEFNNVAELSKLLEKCYMENQNNSDYPSSNIDACITTISENAPPAHSLQVLSQWEHTPVEPSSLVSAIHTSLIRGAREGVRNELSGSLLRIQRARDGRRPIVDNHMMSWNADADESGGGEEEEAGGYIWESVLDGTLTIDK